MLTTNTLLQVKEFAKSYTASLWQSHYIKRLTENVLCFLLYHALKKIKYTHTFKIKTILKAKEVKIVHKNNKQNIKRGKKENNKIKKG